jgi:hypothetical protein
VRLDRLTGMKIISLPLLASLPLLGACTDDGTQEIAAETLSGAVAGQAWTFQAGHTSAFLSEGEDNFFASLYPTTFTPCGFSEPSGDHLIVAIPKQPGDYAMGLSRNMTFVAGGTNLITLDGRIVVDEVTPTTVKGGLVASYDAANQINGRFEVTICPE